ncbi:MHYT domain-containing protein [Streptomyces sp. NPDC048279]|uniref:MHYT domain-containing protein n=1 Tax=Streptomyces sp. NPDC048279 TaxID=3154714 RepID=UPI003421F0F6
MARFRARRTRPEWKWLACGSVALGAGLWGMHLIAWIGFEAGGTPIDCDRPLTVVSGLICVGSTALGLRLADVRRTPRGLIAAGAVMAVGLLGAHALGMAALDTRAGVRSSVGAALASALLTTVGTTAVLWLTATVGSRATAAGASLLVGAELCCAQYTDLAAVSVTPGVSAGRGGGVSGPAFIVPLAAVMILVVLTVAFNLHITPVRDVYDAPARLIPRGMPWCPLPDPVHRVGPAPTLPLVVPVSDERPAIEAGPVVHVGR